MRKRIQLCHMCRRILVLLLMVYGAACFAATTDTITEPFRGVRHIHRVTNVPRPLNINLLEIDLTDPGISFRLTPAGPHWEGSYWEETYRQTTRNFLISQNAQMAVNGSFSSLLGDPDWTRVIRGVAASDGNAYSPFEAPTSRLLWPVLNISQYNVASIHKRDSDYGYDVLPPVTFYNAVSGNEQIVTNGVETAAQVTWGEPTYLHPRTAAGITDDNKLLLVTVDGRQTGFSEGMTNAEVANLLIEFGAVNAINLDGGGSTTMVIADPTVRVVNYPSDGSERANTTNLAVFATPIFSPGYVFADFEGGNESTFNQSLSYSGTTDGINASASSAQAVDTGGIQGNWSQRLIIADDVNQSGGWIVRHVSGVGTRSNNVPRPTRGYVGCWAKTAAADLEMSIAIDNTNNITADRGVFKPLIPDGQWHLYEWGLNNDKQWHHVAAVYNGSTLYLYVDGVLDASRSTTGTIAVNSQNVWIGANSGLVDRYWEGCIDDVAVFKRALTVNEIYNIMRLGVQDPADGSLIAHWPLNRSAEDTSVNGQHGTAVGNVRYVSGVFGQAARFDGDGDYIDCGSSAVFNTIGNAVTVVAWIKVEAFDQPWQTIISKGSNSWRFHRASSNNTLDFYCDGLTPTSLWSLTTKNVNNPQWEAWANGDGVIDTIDFTLDSIQIIGPDADAEVHIDHVAQYSPGSIRYLLASPGDFEPDGDVDLTDFAHFAAHWLTTSHSDAFEALYDIASPTDDVIDLKDLILLVEYWLENYALPE